jgi:GNAT superfamily N-acetyltransferase
MLPYHLLVIEYEIRELEWVDIPHVAKALAEWKSSAPYNLPPAIFLHHFGDLCLAVVSKKSGIAGVMVGTLEPGVPECAMIQLLAVDPVLLGTGTMRLLLTRFIGLAKENGCGRVMIALPHKSRSFIQFFALNGFDPFPPPDEIKVGSLPAGKSDERAGTPGDPAFWWRDYFAAGEHAVVMRLGI